MGKIKSMINYTKHLVEELTGTEIHDIGVPNYDMHYLCLKNCLLNTQNGKDQQFTHKVFLTATTNYGYDKNATCPTWETFIRDFSSQMADQQEFLRAWMRVVLAGSKDAQVFMYIVGPGSTGKSIFAHVLSALLGSERVIQTTLKSLNLDQFETFNLIGKPLIMISDSEAYQGDLTMLKQIVGNDVIRGRAKYVQGSFDVKKTGNIMIIANSNFTAKEMSTAILRRLIVFPAVNISDKRKPLIEPSQNTFTGILADELPGILNWVLKMSLDKALDYLTNPSQVTSLTDFIQNAKKDANPLAK